MLQQEDLLNDKEPWNQRTSISYWGQLGILLGGTGAMMVLASLVAAFLVAAFLHIPVLQVDAALKKVENADLARTVNTVAAFFILFLPALAWARIMKRQPLQQLGFNSILSGKQVFLIVIMAVIALMVSNVMGILNEHIPMPKSFLDKAKAFEKQYSDSVAVMASMKDTKDYLVALFVVAFCPALFEETLFRGGFQQLFVSWTKKPWLGILITSLLFSAFHVSYFGFLARAALGMILGYVFYFSRNIWLNVILHFLNNAIIITIFYRYSLMGRTMDEAEKATNGGSWISMLMLAPIFIFSLVYLFLNFKKESERLLQPGATNNEN